MRPRYILIIFGFITALVALLALARNSISPSIMGSAITEKVAMAPTNPAVYFGVFLVIGVASVVFAIMERKVIN